jgi:hypothetical protein
MNLTVTVLTGRRPHLLRRTLDTFVAHNPGVLDKARLVVMVNGSDDESLEIVTGFPVNVLLATPDLAPIGEATSTLAAAAHRKPSRWWLHLEDDWESTGPVPFDLAGRILTDYPEVGQVRLRRRDEKVMSKHRVTRQPIRWRPWDGWWSAKSAHLTFNPALWRTADIPKAFPCANEVDAMRRWVAAGMHRTAQADPGCFRHIGTDSLRTNGGAP